MSAAPNSRPRSDGLIGVASMRTSTSSSAGLGTGTSTSETSSSPLRLISERSCRAVAGTALLPGLLLPAVLLLPVLLPLFLLPAGVLLLLLLLLLIASLSMFFREKGRVPGPGAVRVAGMARRLQAGVSRVLAGSFATGTRPVV